MDDHYKTLGVQKTASQEEIKSAFRKLAAKHHPDAGGDENKFKEISSAYDTLKDPDRRAKYDAPQNPFNSGHHQGGFRDDAYVHNVDDLFYDLFRRNAGRNQQMRNPDITIAANIDLIDVLEGKEIIANYRLRTGRTETVTINVPPGIKDGTTMRYAGLGDEGIQGVQRGNLFVKIIIIPDQKWIRQDDDLIVISDINALDLIIGCSHEVTTIEKKKVKVKIPAGTKNGTVFGVSNHGLPNINNKIRGRLLVKVHANIPKIESNEVMDKLRELRKDLNS